MSELTTQHISRHVSFSSYGRVHVGRLLAFNIAPFTTYELALKPYIHNHCEIEIDHAGYDLPVPIVYTSLPDWTLIELLPLDYEPTADDSAQQQPELLPLEPKPAKPKHFKKKKPK